MDLTIIDTSVLQRLQAYGEAIFEGYIEKSSVDLVVAKFGLKEIYEIGALSGIMMTNIQENIPFVIPEYSLEETMKVKNPVKRGRRVNWLLELCDWWDNFRKSLGFDKLPERKDIDEIVSRYKLNFLKDDGDRKILAEAVYYGCNSISHMDYKTISSCKSRLVEISIVPHTPSEYCQKFGYVQRDFL